MAKDGVNATLGGSLGGLQVHIKNVENNIHLRGCDIDFKLDVSESPKTSMMSSESGFDSLMVKLEDEVVTLGPRCEALWHC